MLAGRGREDGGDLGRPAEGLLAGAARVGSCLILHLKEVGGPPNGSTLSEAPRRKSRRTSLRLALSIEPFEGMPLERSAMEFEL